MVLQQVTAERKLHQITTGWPILTLLDTFATNFVVRLPLPLPSPPPHFLSSIFNRIGCLPSQDELSAEDGDNIIMVKVRITLDWL